MKTKTPYVFPDHIKSRAAKIRWIEGDIRYERSRGVHTYHLCPYCEKINTRAGRCWECLLDDLRDVKKGT